MEFYIKQNSTLPQLRMELIEDGRSDFWKFHDSVQNSEITFTMTNKNTGLVKIMNAPCYIKLKENDCNCTEQYVICYDWKSRDTKEKGIYEGEFVIKFGEIKSDITTYPKGDLGMPIREKLDIIIE